MLTIDLQAIVVGLSGARNKGSTGSEVREERVCLDVCGRRQDATDRVLIDSDLHMPGNRTHVSGLQNGVRRELILELQIVGLGIGGLRVARLAEQGKARIRRSNGGCSSQRHIDQAILQCSDRVISSKRRYGVAVGIRRGHLEWEVDVVADAESMILVPLVEHAEPGTNYYLRQELIGEPHARPEVGFLGQHQTVAVYRRERDTVLREQRLKGDWYIRNLSLRNIKRGCGSKSCLRRHYVREVTVGFIRRSDEVPAQAKVERQFWMNAPVVLHVCTDDRTDETKRGRKIRCAQCICRGYITKAARNGCRLRVEYELCAIG